MRCYKYLFKLHNISYKYSFYLTVMMFYNNLLIPRYDKL